MRTPDDEPVKAYSPTLEAQLEAIEQMQKDLDRLIGTVAEIVRESADSTQPEAPRVEW